MFIIKKLRELKFLLTRTSYSQAGEDAIVRFLFSDIGLRKISYLDLGTNNPKYGNNTYWFYKNNSRGVCVEADPSLIANIRNCRSKDKIIHAGVSFDQSDTSIFYIFNQAALNTFDINEANKRVKSGKYKIIKEVSVPLLTINEIISKNFDTYPDFLSIDIEGLDYGVLKSLDYNNYPIPVICVETCTYSENHIKEKDMNLINLMIEKDYFVYADTYLNTIFVNNHWFKNK
jgi:FkbM family methyltransferase